MPCPRVFIILLPFFLPYTVLDIWYFSKYNPIIYFKTNQTNNIASFKFPSITLPEYALNQ